MEKVLSLLQNSITEGKKKDQENHEEVLAEYLDSAATIREFYSLPFSIICSIIRKSRIQSVKTIISIISGLYDSGYKNIPIILEYFDSPDANLDDTVQLISSFSSSPICIHLGNIYAYNTNLPEIDYEYKINRNVNKIISLKKELESMTSSFRFIIEYGMDIEKRDKNYKK